VEDRVARGNLVAKRFADLGDDEEQPDARRFYIGGVQAT
jgi:hypothetical protein